MTNAGCREMTETAANPIDHHSSRLDLKQRLLSFAREIGFDSSQSADPRHTRTNFEIGWMKADTVK